MKHLAERFIQKKKAKLGSATNEQMSTIEKVTFKRQACSAQIIMLQIKAIYSNKCEFIILR